MEDVCCTKSILIKPCFIKDINYAAHFIFVVMMDVSKIV
jgi:hypothetical protein